MSTPSQRHTEDWRAIDWKKVQREVFRLQKRIYRAARRGNWKQVRNLQRLMQRSWSARLLAVRRVTLDNRGKRTAGVDGRKKLHPYQQWRMAQRLGKDALKADPVRRVCIPKANGKMRPLGIPTMRDRALQALVKQGLEPEWEAKFEPNSYGFRPGRSTHDAVAALFNHISRKPKYVLDADIVGCFDHIDHDYLLAKLRTIPVYERLIRAWLKADIFDDGHLHHPKAGTPQGGVISPLLANIALHGLETEVKRRFDTDRVRTACVRYADDFVILHQDRDTLEEIQTVVEAWLAKAGLSLSQQKTRIAHTLCGPEPGFDFLGFTFRHHRVGKYKTGKNTHGAALGFTTVIRPSKQAQRKHLAKLKSVLRKSGSLSGGAVIKKLNPLIRGWCHYYRHVQSQRVFARMEHLLSFALRRWQIRKHKGTGKKVLQDRYWDGYTFTSGGRSLVHHGATKIVRHRKVAGTRSPYDGDWLYWSVRHRTNRLWRGRSVKLHQRQQGRCARCGHYFQSGDQVQEHHRDRDRRNMRLDNLLLVHKHCHYAIHREARCQ